MLRLPIYRTVSGRIYQNSLSRLNQEAICGRYNSESQEQELEVETSSIVASDSLNGEHHRLNRRSRLETFCDIVSAIGSGATRPTHIMYRANLSWTVMQDYIRVLESEGLVSPGDGEGNKFYHLTDKGFALLSRYRSIKDDLQMPAEVESPRSVYASGVLSRTWEVLKKN